MTKVVLASNNKGKISELRQILQDLDIEILGLEDIGLGDLDIVEDGDSLEANAYIKARAVYNRLGGDYIVLADDTGLFIDYLQGQPGVNSARFAGDHDDQANRTKVLDLMEGASDRSARFETSIVVLGQGIEKAVRGVLEGQIIQEERGQDGFGYDCIFLPQGFDLTLAQMSLEEKNAISHRRRALDKVLDILSDHL